MSFLNNNDSKGARLSSGALLGAVALHAAVLWGLIMQPQPSVRLPQVLEFALLEPTAQLEKVAPRPHPAPAQPSQVAPPPTATEPEPRRTEQAQPAAAPVASASSEAAPPRNAVADALPVPAMAAAESLPVFDAAYLRNAIPPYPALSRRLREAGRVMLQVRVNPQGLPVSVAVHVSSGFKRLDSAAREAVEGWRFVPARRGTMPIEATVLVPLVFHLES